MSLIRSTFTVAFFTGLSRIMGTIREILLSHIVGASMISDAFVIAFKLPNFFRRFFGEGAFNASFVPQFAGQLAQDGEIEAKKMAERVFSFMGWSLFIFVIAVVIFTKPFLIISMPGLLKTPERMELAISFTRVTFPYVLFISLVAMLSGVLNSLNRFAAAAAVPVLLNVVMIAALLSINWYGFDPGNALCLAVFVAGILQFGWLYFACIRRGFFLKLRFPRLTPDVKKVLKLMIPGSIGAGVMQINLFVDTAISTFLPIGSMSYIYYADRLNQLPLSIFGIAVSTVLLPVLSRYWRQNNLNAAIDMQTKALEFSMQMTLPAAVGLALMSYPFIQLIYGHGKFTNADVLQTAPTLAAFVVGLPAYVAGKIFSTAFFAKHDTKTPVKVAIISVILNIILNLILMQYFLHVGLAIATSISAWVSTFILGYLLHKQGSFVFSGVLIKKLFLMTIAVVAMGISLQIFKNYIILQPSDSVMYEILYNVGGISLGIVVYFIATAILGINAFKNIKETMQAK